MAYFLDLIVRVLWPVHLWRQALVRKSPALAVAVFYGIPIATMTAAVFFRIYLLGALVVALHVPFQYLEFWASRERRAKHEELMFWERQRKGPPFS